VLGALERSLSSVESIAHTLGRALAVPVISTIGNVVAPNILATESHIVGAQAPVRVNDLVVVSRNTRIITNITARGAGEIARVGVGHGGVLVEDDFLRLDVADLLGDDPLYQLMDNGQTLLDDFNLLGVADLHLLLDDDDLVVRPVVVARSVETIKVTHVGVTIIVVQGVSIVVIVVGGVATVEVEAGSE